MPVEIERLQSHVETIAASPRPVGSAAHEAARKYAIEQLELFGWQVTPAPFRGESEEGELLDGINFVAHHDRLTPTNGPRFCVGAHIDSVPGSPGADDNASAVAALLEIARLLPNEVAAEPILGLELVVFDLEEYGMLGGAAHAKESRTSGIDLRGMVSLEMLGYCDHAPGSQQLPRSLVGLYPETGNFIAVIGNQNSGPLCERFKAGMSRVKELPVESLLVPDNGNLLQATRLSDHSPFWDAGYPALMITDTSFLRNPHYHMPTDVPETLDWEFLRLVTQGCLAAVREVITAGL